MSGKPDTDIPEIAGHPLSGLTLPPDVRFADDRQGREARMLLVGYAECLADAVRTHEPLQVVREMVARINEIIAAASHREIARMVGAAKVNGRAN